MANEEMNVPTALEALTTWRSLLSELGANGAALCDAIANDNVVGAIATMMQMRRVRADLVRVEAPARLRGDASELEAMAEVTALTIDARASEIAMAQWTTRELPPDASLMSSALGVAVLADHMLPTVWDFDTDLVVLIGAGFEPVAQILADVGQRRLVVLGGDPAQVPTTAIHVTSTDELVTALRTLTPIPPTQFVLRAVPGSAPDEVAHVMKTTRDALSDLRIHRNTVRSFSKTWVAQGAANLPAIGGWPSVETMDQAFAGMPMIIVAPGPSLAKNVDQLRALKGKAIICALSHSLKAVLAAGVEPDFVMTVDPQDVGYHFEGCDLGGSCLLNAATVHPSLFELPAQRMLTLSANCAVDDWLFDAVGESALVPGGGSVATSAFSLALRWQCDPIVFVGLDLSFPGGKYYVATSTDGDARAEIDADGVMKVAGWSKGFHAMKASGGPEAASERAIELPGWSGGTVPSGFMLGLFHRWFVEQLAAMAGAPGLPRIYNCTEGGAFIEGMTHVPLSHVAPQLATSIDVGAILDDAIDATDPSERTARLSSHVKSYLLALRRTKKLALRAQQLIARPETPNREARLGRLERAIGAAVKPLNFVSLLADREIERAQDVARRDGTEDTYLAATFELFAGLVRVIDEVSPVLESAMTHLRPRRKRVQRRAA